MLGGWSMQGGQTKQGELFIALTHEDHKHIIFDRVLKAGNSVLLVAKMVIKNPEALKTSRVIHSRDVKWIGKMWAEFYKIKMIDRASGYVDPDEDFQLEEEEDQDIEEEDLESEENESEIIQVGQSQAEEPTETPVGVEDDDPVASRTRSQTAADEPIVARTRQALGSDPEMSAFVDVKDEKTLNEWLHEIAFVTSTMSDPDEPQSFQEAWWDPDLIAREKW